MLKHRDYEAVAYEYNKIAPLKKNEGYADYAYGLGYYYQKKFQSAKQAFERALEKGIRTQKKTMEPLVKIALITTNVELRKWNEAKKWIDDLEKEMEKGKKLNPKLLSIYYPIKGEYFYHLQRYQEAKRAFDLAYIRYPDLVGEEAYYYAHLLHKEGEDKKAKEILRKLLQEKHAWKFFRVPKQKAIDLLRNIEG